MLTLVEWGGIALLTTLTGLLSAYIVYRVIKPRLQATIRGYIPVVTKSIKRSMGEIASEAAENLDLGAIAGQLGGGEGEGNPLAAISGLLGGGSGGIGDLLGLLTQFSGQKTKKGGHSPGK